MESSGLERWLGHAHIGTRRADAGKKRVRMLHGDSRVHARR
jgi:hypothetical protein